MQPQAPAWLASSQKWLKSAGKRVAQAAKETTAQLQARLEEFEGRSTSHRGMLRPVSSMAHAALCCYRCSLQAAMHACMLHLIRPCHQVHVQQEDAVNQNELHEQPGTCPAGGAERANSFAESDTPAYFHDWAAKIEAMPPDRAASTLEALAEQDRLRVQRIMDEHAMQRSRSHAASPRSAGPPSFRARRWALTGLCAHAACAHLHGIYGAHLQPAPPASCCLSASK